MNIRRLLAAVLSLILSVSLPSTAFAGAVYTNDYQDSPGVVGNPVYAYYTVLNNNNPIGGATSTVTGFAYWVTNGAAQSITHFLAGLGTQLKECNQPFSVDTGQFYCPGTQNISNKISLTTDTTDQFVYATIATTTINPSYYYAANVYLNADPAHTDPTQLVGTNTGSCFLSSSDISVGNQLCPYSLKNLWIQLFDGAATVPNYKRVGPHISTSTTWSTGEDYLVQGEVQVDSGVTLTIDPGVIVKFADASSSLTVNGTLNATGTEAAKIYFSSINDEIVGSDLTASSSVGAAGDWGTIRGNSDSEINIANAEIRFAGASGEGAVSNYGGRLIISSSTIATSSNYGLFTSGADAHSTLKYSVVRNNDYGVVTADGGDVLVASSTVMENNRGLSLTGGVTGVLDSDVKNNVFGIYSDEAKLQVDSSRIFANTTGINIVNANFSDVTINSSSIHNNNYGIGVHEGYALIYGNSFENNTVFGLFSSSTASSTSATYNWWNATSGPSVSGGTGLGDRVSSNVRYDGYFTDSPRYLITDFYGQLISSVGPDKKIYWSGDPGKYASEWSSAINTWNAATDTIQFLEATSTTPNLYVSVVDEPNLGFAAFWDPYTPPNHRIVLNQADLDRMQDDIYRESAILHELGHSLGLAHSTPTNVMYYAVTGLTFPAAQDLDDYNYLIAKKYGY